MEYNKLVRDKIPQIIEDKGLVPEWSQIKESNPQMVREYLIDKLKEEFNELIQSIHCGCPKDVDEECADLAEVISAISSRFGQNDWKTVMETKYIERGGFDDLIVLSKVEQNEQS